MFDGVFEAHRLLLSCSYVFRCLKASGNGIITIFRILFSKLGTYQIRIISFGQELVLSANYWAQVYRITISKVKYMHLLKNSQIIKIFKKHFLKNILFFYMCVCVCVQICTCTCRSGVLDAPKAGIIGSVNCLKLVFGTQRRSSARPVTS